ncbi:hypothetical protein VB834_07175 [Limnoraphis robusta Tam1]|jgi:hypothetical protein|uniref:hypothetical protein n=1 Tax=Limnoraphis robusta TaxID=1118279 RepID=UPI001F9B223C|nr:hypothetical protein [Limnoraphis robusta]MCG5061266.1 hypothetical protein [Limnoraphis sp. WC205]MEA5538811.1 hypothetical protein [Limnoraphis robusta Tam1]
MDASHTLTSSCRCCQYYTPEGRRGGHCSQLHVPVKGGWKACHLAMLAFSSPWEEAQKMVVLPQKVEVLPDKVSVAVLAS